MYKVIPGLLLLLLLSGCSFLAPLNSGSPSSLDISGSGISQVPEYVYEMREITELNVSDNQIDGALQAEIRNLQNLEVLIASNNEMTGVPAEIGQLHKLRVLDLSNNKLTGLPQELGNLSKLERLDISGNDYSAQDLATITEQLPSTVEIVK